MYLGLATRITRPGGDTPSLLINLLQNALDSRLTFSRASTATEVVNGVVTSFGVDTPRVTSAQGLHIEGSRTNTSNNGSAWTFNSCSGTAGQPDPAGGTAAYLVTANAGTLSIYSEPPSTTSNVTGGSVYTMSIFIKAGSINRFQLVTTSGATSAYANFYLSGAGSVSASGGGATNAFVTALANGWYRVGMTFTATGGATSNVSIRPIQSGSEARSTTLTWAGGETYTICFGQHELGYGASSYIPTTTASATRAADLCTLTTGVWLNEAEGTVWVEATPVDIDPAAATSPRVLHISGGTSYHEIKRNAADSIAQSSTTTSGVVQSGLAGTAWISGVTARAAYAWKNNDMAFCFAGGTVATDTASPDGMPTGLTTLRLGANSATTGFLFGWVRGVRFWTRRQGNEQLKGLTT